MRRSCRGFTLAEVLVAVAILGVLVAVGIPLFKGSVQKSQAEACTANRKVAAAGADAAGISFTSDGGVNNSARAKLSTYIGEGHKNPDICPAGGRLTVSADGKWLYCSIHDHAGAPNIYLEEALKDLPGKAMVDSDGKPVTGANAQKIFNIGSEIDSTAPSQGGGRATTILYYLKQNGIDLDVLNVKTWAVKEKGKALYWSDQDITGLKTGDKVRVMKYNVTTGTYTAGYMAVEQMTGSIDKSVTYMHLKNSTFSEYKTKDVVQSSTTKKDYYTTLDFYEGMPEKPE